jgi:hypothetical protein
VLALICSLARPTGNREEPEPSGSVPEMVEMA